MLLLTLETGKVGGKLVGIVTSRDVQFQEDLDAKVSTVMTTDLITGKQGITLTEGN